MTTIIYTNKIETELNYKKTTCSGCESNLHINCIYDCPSKGCKDLYCPACLSIVKNRYKKNCCSHKIPKMFN